MSLPLIINPMAEADLADAKQWYDGRRPGLGDEFLDCVDRTLDRIREWPESYAKEFQELRRATVNRFPYAIVYRVDPSQITVVAVYDLRRNSRFWQRRR